MRLLDVSIASMIFVAVFGAALSLAPARAVPAPVQGPTYELRVLTVYGGEVHESVEDYGLSADDCADAVSVLYGAACVAEAA